MKLCKKIWVYATSYNSLVDAHNDQSEKVTWLRAKVADSEGRSRRNNIKIRGIPETTQTSQLKKYTCDLMKVYLPTLSDSDLTVDRIHCLPKPSHFLDNIPREVLMQVHFFHTKEQFMIAFHKS